ncbi:uncharacterized protein [Amphiura filiformis]|uniref:uncharacterized protein isoform X1 n=1 Tax=Amphiura filiformis TaxID=82378 RepID=UPI003B214EB0
MVNILDLRHTLLSLKPGHANYTVTDAKKYDVDPMGLFNEISPNRTCKSMGISPEAGKCICERGKPVLGVTNTTDVLLLAEYAIGHINNIIQDQFKKANTQSKSGFGACQRLIPIRVTNVYKTVYKEEQTLEFDVHVMGGAEQDEDTFALVFEMPTSTPTNNSNLVKLVHYGRITRYAVYDKCRDKGVSGPVCVCSLKTQIRKPNSHGTPKWHLKYMKVLGHTTTLAGSSNCIYVYERRTTAGLVLEASSDCLKWKFAVTVQVQESLNIVTSKPVSDISVNLDPGMMVFLVAFVQ